MNENRAEVRVAEWRDLPRDSRSGLEVFLSDYRNLPVTWRLLLAPAALIGPFMAVAFFPSAAVWAAGGAICMLAVGSFWEAQSVRKILSDEAGAEGYSVRIALSRYGVRYAEDIGTVRFVDDFLVYEGQRTTFSFDCSALKEWTDVFKSEPSSARFPFLVLETPGKPIGISFESMEPEHLRRHICRDHILLELTKLRKRRSIGVVINVLPPLEPLRVRKRTPVLQTFLAIGIFTLFAVFFAADALHDPSWHWSSFVGPVSGAFVGVVVKLSEKKKRDTVLAQLRREAEVVRHRQLQNRVPLGGPPESIVGVTSLQPSTVARASSHQ